MSLRAEVFPRSALSRRSRVHLRGHRSAQRNPPNNVGCAHRRCFASRGFTLKVIGNGQSKIEAGSQQLRRRFDNSEGMLA